MHRGKSINLKFFNKNSISQGLILWAYPLAIYRLKKKLGLS